MPQLVVHAHELKTLMTPVYGGGRSGYVTRIRITCGNLMHFFLSSIISTFTRYVPDSKRAETEMPINAPVYKGVQDKNMYNPQVSRCGQMNKLKYPIR